MPLANERKYTRIPSCQILDLGDKGLLVRHTRGLSVLHGVALQDVRELLHHAHEATLDDIAADSGLDHTLTRNLIERLSGEAVAYHPPRETPPSIEKMESVTLDFPVIVVGNGPFSERLWDTLHNMGNQAEYVAIAPGITEDPHLIHFMEIPQKVIGQDHSEALDRDGVVVCIPEGMSYGQIHQLQKTFLDQGKPVLFASHEPDGPRVGPFTLPGTACIGCAHLAAFSFLDPSSIFDRLSQLRTGIVKDGHELVGKILKVLASLHVGCFIETVDGMNRSHGIDRDPRCQICTGKGGQPSPLARALMERAVWRLSERGERRPVTTTFQPTNPLRSVCVLGGGTAGYLAALGLLAKNPNVRVTLIESSEIPIIGVGEATTPLLPQFLHVDLGIDIHHFFKAVQPTLKLGIRFQWGAPEGGVFNYPFGAMRLSDAFAHEGHIGNASIRAMAMNENKVPLSPEGLSLLGRETGYHIDNRALAAFLRAIAAQRGLERIDTKIVDAITRDGETLSALVDQEGRHHEYDLFLDCSGFTSMLMGRTLQSPFVSFSKGLMTDAAVVAAVPHHGHIKPYTLAETMDAGWCWNTPMRNEDHRGYVFSTAFLSPEKAEQEMRMANPGMGPSRLIRFKSGRRTHFWKGNVFALGNAYGFVEPLESTALHMTIRQIGMILRLLPLDGKEEGLRALVNREANGFWDYLHWFLAIHYKYNRQRDTPFWRSCREETDISTYDELIKLFQDRGPISSNQTALAFFNYPDPLWGAEGIDTILLGQGVPTRGVKPVWKETQWRDWRARVNLLLKQSLVQADALDMIDRKPAYLSALARAFHDAGHATVRNYSESPGVRA